MSTLYKYPTTRSWGNLLGGAGEEGVGEELGGIGGCGSGGYGSGLSEVQKTLMLFYAKTFKAIEKNSE